ncbi:hypothetical protein B0J12DRAFT_12256 [Macrophomina phaseolina]|uniref:Uncharacterized protein n=1 Tax=Macrophomina phaseolina TaxID=35725 RepID=A0ABQ8GX83_9PEZI|nr:hypothetical protein B0J12DRAFT_12256 [Macrophomina phaseolina]
MFSRLIEYFGGICEGLFMALRKKRPKRFSDPLSHFRFAHGAVVFFFFSISFRRGSCVGLGIIWTVWRIWTFSISLIDSFSHGLTELMIMRKSKKASSSQEIPRST